MPRQGNSIIGFLFVYTKEGDYGYNHFKRRYLFYA
jgi:hypothetical protein